MSKRFALTVVAISMGVSAFFFQNCARVAFNANQMASGGVDGLHTLPAPIGDMGPIGPSLPVATPQPNSGGPSGDQQVDNLLETCREVENWTPPEPSQMKCENDISITSLNESRSFNEVRDLRITSAHADLSVTGARDVRMTSVQGNVSIESQSVQMTSYAAGKSGDRLRVNTGEFKGMTAAHGTILISANRFQSSTSVQGELCVKAKDFGSLTSINGTVELIGASVGQMSNLGSITSVNGLLILKNIKLQSITSVNGKLVLINSRVERITSASQAIYLQNSSVGMVVSAPGGMIRF